MIEWEANAPKEDEADRSEHPLEILQKLIQETGFDQEYNWFAANLRAEALAQLATEGIAQAANGAKEEVKKALTKIRAMISHMTVE